VNENLGVSPSLSVGGRAIRHSLHSAIAPLRSNNTYYPLRKERTIARQKNEQSQDLSKNLKSLHDVRAGADSVGAIRYAHMREDSLRIENKSVPFGNILIIHESRPDVTIEAASLTFKADNKILLKGGKEARKPNLFLVNIWHQALREMGM